MYPINAESIRKFSLVTLKRAFGKQGSVQPQSLEGAVPELN